MKATPAFVTVCMLLGCSVLLNVVLLTRPRDAEPQPRAAAPVRPEPAAPREEISVARTVSARSLEPVRRPEAPVAEVRGKPPVPALGVSVRDDPAVAAVIDAQSAYRAFWNDLEQLFRAKSRLDEQKVFQTALATTMDFLELPGGTRPSFVEAARSGAAGIALARAEEDAAKRALPPKDKSNPAAEAARDQQRKAIDARYKEQVKAAVDGLKSRLDLQNPRHVEFASNSEKWLKNLVPRQQ